MKEKWRQLIHSETLRGWLALGLLASYIVTTRLNRPVRSRVFIQGAGNSGNHVYLEGLADELATRLVKHEAYPQISDEELVTMMQALHARALAGEPQAVLVAFRLAQLQQKLGKEDV